MPGVLGVAEGDVLADNAKALAAGEAHKVGMPRMVENVLWGSRAEDKRDPDLLAFGSRMTAEPGADVIETGHTGDVGTMAPVVEGCPVRPWRSGDRRPTPRRRSWRSPGRP